MGARCPKERGSDAERCEKGFLRYLYAAHLLHAALAFFLLFQQLAFAGNVAAVAFGRYVLAVGTNGLAGDYAFAHGGLYRNLELLAGDEFLEFFDQGGS